jgi:serine/threonine protein kinase
MEYLHSLHPAIIHRDLKALNVLKSFDGRLKVCDFGLVMVRHSQAGTPSYMAPGLLISFHLVCNLIPFLSLELFQGRPFTKAVDVYAFGVLLWEIFTQQIPFNQTPIPEICERVISGDRPLIPSYGFSPDIADLIKSCW